MPDDPKKFDFTKAINQLEEINNWFQNEDFNLDEGLQKLKQGKELIKKCRTRLHEVENEFVKVKKEFAEDSDEQKLDGVEEVPDRNGAKNIANNGEVVNSDDVPF
jgi:exodeoxyribonuclease VII small subunit